MDSPNFLKRNGNKKLALPKAKQIQEEILLENVKKVSKNQSEETQKLLIQCLKKHFVFFNFSIDQLSKIASTMFYCEAQTNEFIFQQNDDASTFFIIQSGAVQVIINKQKKHTLSNGQSFGELALLYNAPRSASILATQNCRMWGLGRTGFRKMLEDLNQKEFSENRKFLQRVKVFQNLNSEQKDAISSVLINLKYNAKDNIVIEGDPGNSFYILKKGKVGVYKGSKLVRILCAGDSFGEQALYFTQWRTMTCKAEEDDTICVSIGRSILNLILGDQIQISGLKNQIKWIIEKSEILSQLTKLQIEKVLDEMKIQQQSTNDVIIKANSPANENLYFCINTGLKLSKGQNIASDDSI